MDPSSHALVIGADTDLGLSIADKLEWANYTVIDSGHQKPEHTRRRFWPLDLDLTRWELLSERIGRLVESLPQIDLLVFIAECSQEGPITRQADYQIRDAVQIGLNAPAMLLAHLLRKQQVLPGFIAISHTESIPQPLGTLHRAVTSGFAAFADALSSEAGIGKVLVATPADKPRSTLMVGKQPFWEEHPTERAIKGGLDPKWIAKHIIRLYGNNGEPYRFRSAHMLRDPAGIELIETR